MRKFALLLTVAAPVFALQTQPTPEPSTMLMVGGGIAAVIVLTRMKRNRKK
jgi:hypothetical protein